jgi:leucyl-tRNA synthetase
MITIPIQVNGRVRSEIEINKDDTEDVVKEKALSDEKINKFIDGKNVKKFIYIPGKIVNIVL